MAAEKTETPRPLCEVCGNECARTTRYRPGKGGYQCITSGCPNMLKKIYVRESGRKIEG